MTRILLSTVVALLVGSALPAKGQVRFQITIEPLPAEFARLEPTIRTHLLTAAQMWAEHVNATNCMVAIVFRLQKWPARGFGRSLYNVPLKGEKHDGKFVTEEGLPHKLRTGEIRRDPGPDVEMAFDPNYFKTLWFDPDPKTRNAPVPRDKLDALSVFLHELGHAMGFNGFMNPSTGAFSGEYMSTYDQWVTRNGTEYSFNGPDAMKLYGRPIPLARRTNNYHHLGDNVPGVDLRLRCDLMNGVFMDYGRRYTISGLDMAILEDRGLPVKR
jgi:hypothetical protein